MKVSIITLHAVYNYGTQLQAFATQEKFMQFFDEVEFIDYKRPDTYGIGLIKTFTKGNPLKTIAILPTILYWKKVFGRFQTKYLNLSQKKYYSDESFKNFCEDSDAYFVGSDQVWNCGWNRGVIPPLYLNFIHKKPKYSYSSSFGRNKIDYSEINYTKNYIDQFKYITVREESGVNILKQQYNYNNVFTILDPTLAMPASFWRKYTKVPKINGDYILIYNLNRSKDFDEYVDKIAKKLNIKKYRFCTRFDQIFRTGIPLVIPDVLDFVSYIDHAKYVITDSFHATAFAVNLNTPPICIYPEQYSTRLDEFLELVDLKEQHVVDFSNFKVLENHIDFSKANSILDNERKKVDRFLEIVQEDIVKNMR